MRSRARKQRAELRVVIHKDVIDQSIELVAENPDVEVGGKFVGYVIGDQPLRSDYLRRLHEASPDVVSHITPCILIAGMIGSGPAADATSVSLLPDAEFQLRTYRAVERAEPELEHVGSWHSHHPNGLRDFSLGDREHYGSVVVDANYNLDLFVAGLAIDDQGLRTGIFDLWSRPDPNRPERLTGDRVQVLAQGPSLRAEIAAAEAGGPGHLGAATHIPATRADLIQHHLEAALGCAGRRVDHEETVSWVFGPDTVARTGSNAVAVGVVTYTGGPAAEAVMSVRSSLPSAELTLTATGPLVSFDDLRRSLLDVCDRIVAGLRSADRSPEWKRPAPPEPPDDVDEPAQPDDAVGPEEPGAPSHLTDAEEGGAADV